LIRNSRCDPRIGCFSFPQLAISGRLAQRPQYDIGGPLARRSRAGRHDLVQSGESVHLLLSRRAIFQEGAQRRRKLL
jgi:hypothetical protein